MNYTYDDGDYADRFSSFAPSWKKIIALGAGGILIAFVLAMWFVVRIEVNEGQILALVNKTGKSLPPELQSEYGDQVVLYPGLVKKIAATTGESEEYISQNYKGVRYVTLSEGRHWRDPFHYKRIVMDATVIDDHEYGVLIRKYGQPLTFPKTVAAKTNERGPVADILMPGRHNINLLAYEVLRFDVMQIPEGHVGVVTQLSGEEPRVKNTFTVEPGETGVQRATLPAGQERPNPYLEKIDIVDVRSQKYDMLFDDAIRFPSNDSFEIRIEGTIEWAIRKDRVAEVTVAYGDEEDILNKVILPNARSIARIQGSKLSAREFISGKTRTAFQQKLLEELKRECYTQGIEIKSALVRDIQAPPDIAGPISQREQADQEIERSTNEMEEARAEARLVEQQELQMQNREIGEARRKVVAIVKEAEQRKIVAITEARRELEVAKLALEAAEKQAAAIRSKGQAEANVILFDYQARAEPLAMAVEAFGDGTTYAQMFFLEKIAPSIESILSNTEGPFAEIFNQFQQFPSAPQGGQQ